MKILFLDLDGVMCTSACYGRGKKNKWESYMFDPKSVAILNFILQETGAEIILTSDWRTNYTLQEMREIFTHNFVLKGPIGFTPSSNTYLGNNLEGGRTDEIRMWLNTHAWKNDIKWVVVDDLNMSSFFPENFVHCPNENEGIKRQGIKEKILEILA
jgi:hypothetical protein